MSATQALQISQARPFIDHVKQHHPLVHCITNDVVQNFTANVLLAIGASPAMVIAKQEVASFVKVANSLLINVGTLDSNSAESMLLAAASAQKNHIPWVLDPVAVGPKITGTGCSLSAMVAAFIAGSTNTLLATASACFMMKKAGELGNKQQGLGTYAVSLIDQLSLFNPSHI